MAECRSRSGQGENKEEEGASIAIGPGSLPVRISHRSGAGVAALSHVGGFARRLGVEPERRLRRRFDRAPMITSRNVSKITEMTKGAR